MKNKINDIAKVAGLELGVLEGTPAKGANKDVYRLVTKDGRLAALKVFRKSDLWRMKYNKECQFLEGCNRAGIRCTPTLIDCCDQQGWLIESWLDGDSPLDVGWHELAAVNCFVNLLRNSDYSSWEIGNAADSMVDRIDYLKCLDGKARALIDVRTENILAKELLKEIRVKYEGLVISTLRKADIAFQGKAWEGGSCCVIPSPSDIGCHNMKAGKFAIGFFDFEHSGWDRPEKLYGDLIVRPGNVRVGDHAILERLADMEETLGVGFVERVEDVLPSIKLKWILIMLDPRRLSLISQSKAEVIRAMMNDVMAGR